MIRAELKGLQARIQVEKDSKDFTYKKISNNLTCLGDVCMLITFITRSFVFKYGCINFCKL